MYISLSVQSNRDDQENACVQPIRSRPSGILSNYEMLREIVILYVDFLPRVVQTDNEECVMTEIQKLPTRNRQKNPNSTTYSAV